MGKGVVSVADSFVWLVAIAFLLDGEGIVLWFLLAAAVHELGHVCAILLCGGQITKFRLTCAGGMLRYHLPRETTCERACIAGAGPFAGLVLAVVAMPLQANLLEGASLLLSIFNLLPIPPLDGGTLCGALLPNFRAQQAAAMLSLCSLWVAGGMVAWQAHGLGLLFVAVLLSASYMKSHKDAHQQR